MTDSAVILLCIYSMIGILNFVGVATIMLILATGPILADSRIYPVLIERQFWYDKIISRSHHLIFMIVALIIFVVLILCIVTVIYC